MEQKRTERETRGKRPPKRKDSIKVHERDRVDDQRQVGSELRGVIEFLGSMQNRVPDGPPREQLAEAVRTLETVQSGIRAPELAGHASSTPEFAYHAPSPVRAKKQQDEQESFHVLHEPLQEPCSGESGKRLQHVNSLKRVLDATHETAVEKPDFERERPNDASTWQAHGAGPTIFQSPLAKMQPVVASSKDSEPRTPSAVRLARHDARPQELNRTPASQLTEISPETPSHPDRTPWREYPVESLTSPLNMDLSTHVVLLQARSVSRQPLNIAHASNQTLASQISTDASLEKPEACDQGYLRLQRVQAMPHPHQPEMDEAGRTEAIAPLRDSELEPEEFYLVVDRPWQPHDASVHPHLAPSSSQRDETSTGLIEQIPTAAFGSVDQSNVVVLEPPNVAADPVQSDVASGLPGQTLGGPDLSPRADADEEGQGTVRAANIRNVLIRACGGGLIAGEEKENLDASGARPQNRSNPSMRRRVDRPALSILPRAAASTRSSLGSARDRTTNAHLTRSLGFGSESGPAERQEQKRKHMFASASESCDEDAGEQHQGVSDPSAVQPARQSSQVFTPSEFCHICRRSKLRANLMPCGNLRDGRCKKVLCSVCFDRFGWSWKTASRQNRPLALLSQQGEVAGQAKRDLAADRDWWLCCHCMGECPPTAACAYYGTKRRKKASSDAEEAEGSNAVAVASDKKRRL
ncbi:hypothetical protein FVE85_3949 [Porphyridium purpureum]|uniref:Zinc-finger domain-containing protein n=1 Tax=Porphyridium purpureum TaxID=35688 RepID=A0A5J4YTE8_PORPP|nr:hypothetical protein FVE85_3949 [Porphyridium purpureum]|eukprot:POR6304..scf229_5